MEDEQIEIVKNWLELKLMTDIQVFLGYANFYKRFIKSFGKIARPLISMLQTSSTTRSSKILLSSNNVAESDKLCGSGGSDCENRTVEKSICSKDLNEATDYLTPDTRQAFTQLRQVFTKALILRHFDLECQIRIETDVSGYAIGGVLNQFNNLGQWYSMAYYFRKMIPAKTWYKTYNRELLAIVKAFKIWRHYLKGCKHKVLMLTDHNNLCRFMDTKSLSFCYIWWAQELSWYHFQKDNRQGKANMAADTLSWLSQWHNKEKAKL